MGIPSTFIATIKSVALRRCLSSCPGSRLKTRRPQMCPSRSRPAQKFLIKPSVPPANPCRQASRAILYGQGMGARKVPTSVMPNTITKSTVPRKDNVTAGFRNVTKLKEEFILFG